MTRFYTILYGCIFACIIVTSNYAVQFNIGSSYLTYGALTYPFSFLFLDILSEKNDKKDVLKALRYGILFAFIPSLLISEPLIAIASISAFLVSQPLDVIIFYFFKKVLPKLWWLRNNISTIIAQFFDTMIFFHIAFLAEKGSETVFMMALFDFCIKIILSLIDTPFFYIFAIALKAKFTNK